MSLNNTYIIFYLVVQVVVLILTFRRQNLEKSPGIATLFLMNLLVLHGGAFIYLLGGYDANQDLYIRSYRLTEETVPLGCLATAIAILSFYFGGTLFRLTFLKTSERIDQQVDSERYTEFVIRSLIVIGVCSFIITKFLQRTILGFDAIFLVGQNCLSLGLILKIRDSVEKSKHLALALYLTFFMLVPIYYLFTFGFVSFGFQYVLMLGCFLACNFRLNRKHYFATIVGAPIAYYLLLTVLVIYMEQRNELRSVLWSDAGFSERINSIGRLSGGIHSLSFSDNQQLAMIDSRLNQNIFVGKTIEFLEYNQGSFGEGESIWDACFAWLPRVFWESKPEFGGTAILQRYTGMRFGGSVTMQTGPVFEFYANFGWLGVFAGMLLYGAFIEYIDAMISKNLKSGSVMHMIPFYLMGITMSWPGSTLMAQFSYIAATVVFYIFFRSIVHLKSTQ